MHLTQPKQRTATTPKFVSIANKIKHGRPGKEPTLLSLLVTRITLVPAETWVLPCSWISDPQPSLSKGCRDWKTEDKPALTTTENQASFPVSLQLSEMNLCPKRLWWDLPYPSALFPACPPSFFRSFQEHFPLHSYPLSFSTATLQLFQKPQGPNLESRNLVGERWQCSWCGQLVHSLLFHVPAWSPPQAIFLIHHFRQTKVISQLQKQAGQACKSPSL